MPTKSNQLSAPGVPSNNKVAEKSADDLLVLEQGQLLFAQGETGGDLFFIQSGTIEIFVTKDGQEIVLSQMGVGEVIGIMSLFSQEPRMAAARAKERAVVKKVSGNSVTQAVSALPKWLQIVLNEFRGRVNDMNRRYSEASLLLKTSRETQITPLFLATQMAQAQGLVGRAIAKTQDGESIVLVDELLENMEFALNQPREMIDNIWNVFTESGLVKIEIEPERKQKIIKLEKLEKVAGFTQFVRESNQGSTRKIIKARFKYKEIRTLQSLVKFVLKQGVSPDKSASFKVSEIAPTFERVTGVTWDLAHLEKPAALGLVVKKGDGESLTLTFTPATLARTLGCVAAMKKFLGDDEHEISDNHAGKASEAASPAITSERKAS